MVLKNLIAQRLKSEYTMPTIIAKHIPIRLLKGKANMTVFAFFKKSFKKIS